MREKIPAIVREDCLINGLSLHDYVDISMKRVLMPSKILIERYWSGNSPEMQVFVPERTCHDDGGNDEFFCSECGCVLCVYDESGGPNILTNHVFDWPRFCPNCGAKVVDE